MKKLLFIISAFLIINPVLAKNVKVEALSDFSTANPPKYWKLKVTEGFVADNGIIVHEGTIFEGKIVVCFAKKIETTCFFYFHTFNLF